MNANHLTKTVKRVNPQIVSQMMNNIKLGERGTRTNVQRFFNCTFWFMASSRNAIVMILATLIATFFTVPHAEENPFILTGRVYAHNFFLYYFSSFSTFSSKLLTV